MAYREFQTAAARVIHLTQPTEADVRRLATEFHFHPLDLEAVLSVSPKARISAYHEYVRAALPWPLVDPRRHRLSLSEFQLFIGPGYLVVIDDDSLPAVRTTLDQWETDASVNQDRPVLLAYDLLLNMVKQAAVAFHHAPHGNWSAAIAPLVSAYATWKEAMAERGWAQPREIQDALAYLGFSFKRLAHDVTRSPRTPLVVSRTPAPLIKNAVTGYIFASAIMTVLVLLIISFRR